MLRIFSTTRIPIRLFYVVNFSRTIVAQIWQIAENFVQVATVENKLWFVRCFLLLLQKYVYDGPKYMLGIQFGFRSF
jgi:hypothetical protein